MGAMQKIKTLIKQPSTWVILIIGVIVAFAYGSRIPGAGALNTVASKLPAAGA